MLWSATVACRLKREEVLTPRGMLMLQKAPGCRGFVPTEMRTWQDEEGHVREVACAVLESPPRLIFSGRTCVLDFA